MMVAKKSNLKGSFAVVIILISMTVYVLSFQKHFTLLLTNHFLASDMVDYVAMGEHILKENSVGDWVFYKYTEQNDHPSRVAPGAPLLFSIIHLFGSWDMIETAKWFPVYIVFLCFIGYWFLIVRLFPSYCVVSLFFLLISGTILTTQNNSVLVINDQLSYLQWVSPANSLGILFVLGALKVILEHGSHSIHKTHASLAIILFSTIVTHQITLVVIGVIGLAYGIVFYRELFKARWLTIMTILIIFSFVLFVPPLYLQIEAFRYVANTKIESSEFFDNTSISFVDLLYTIGISVVFVSSILLYLTLSNRRIWKQNKMSGKFENHNDLKIISVLLLSLLFLIWFTLNARLVGFNARRFLIYYPTITLPILAYGWNIFYPYKKLVNVAIVLVLLLFFSWKNNERWGIIEKQNSDTRYFDMVSHGEAMKWLIAYRVDKMPFNSNQEVFFNGLDFRTSGSSRGVSIFMSTVIRPNNAFGMNKSAELLDAVYQNPYNIKSIHYLVCNLHVRYFSFFWPSTENKWQSQAQQSLLSSPYFRVIYENSDSQIFEINSLVEQIPCSHIW